MNLDYDKMCRLKSAFTRARRAQINLYSAQNDCYRVLSDVFGDNVLDLDIDGIIYESQWQDKPLTVDEIIDSLNSSLIEAGSEFRI